MKTENITIISKQDGLQLDGLIVAAEEPKAVLQLAHGMCEHKERYIPFMEYMAAQGFACVIHDHRGHGRSIKSDADLGYFYENGGEALVEDIYQVMEETKNRFPRLTYFLMGHSMGSLAVRCFIKKYDKDIDGLIVCGCPSANDMAGIGLSLVHLLQKIKGDHARSVLADKLFSDGFEKPFKAEKLSHAWICSDRTVVERYNADKYCNFTFTLNGYESLLWLVTNTYSTEGWTMGHKDLPIHFISGADDSCMINKKKFSEAVELLKNLGYTKVTWKLYDGMRHEILNENGKEQVFEDIAACLQETLKK